MKSPQRVMKMSNPLRYEIVDWHQAIDARSNNDADLRIRVTDFINDERLTGLRISVVHPNFGVLFTCVLNAKGTMVTEINDNMTYELTTEQVIDSLAKYGFIIVYKQKSELPADQLTFLETLLNLGFDKLRILNVYTVEFGERRYKPYIVVFNVTENPEWLINTHTASYTEFTTALANGSAVNIAATSQVRQWSWGWLDFVANISDILAENAD